jgi:peptide/nickel transport system permease protein
VIPDAPSGPAPASLARWLGSRLVQAVVTFAIAVTLLFFLMRLAPGDPLSRLTEDRPLAPQAIAALRTRYGLDQPLLTQFAAWLGGVVRGDLGISIEAGRPVTALLAERLPATLLLGGTVLLLNFTIGVWLGVWQARRRGTTMDRAAGAVTLAAYATPSFWLGLVLAWVFGTTLHWLPVAGYQSPWLGEGTGLLSRVADHARHLVLPAITLSVATMGATIRYQRAAMVDVLDQDYLRTARMKGLTERTVTWRHGWRTAIGPVLTLFGLWLPLLVAGSVFVESVFAWPGLGTLSAQAIGGRDYPVLMGTALLVSATVILGNLLAELLQRLLDPRIRSV